MTAFNRDFAATVLLEAAYTTDAIACQKYGITERTLRRYRKSLTEDTALVDVMRVKQEEFNKRWAEEFPVLMIEAAKTLRSCFEEIRNDKDAKKNPMLIQAISDSVTRCGDVFLTSKAIDARIAPQDRPKDGLFGSDSAEGADVRPS